MIDEEQKTGLIGFSLISYDLHLKKGSENPSNNFINFNQTSLACTGEHREPWYHCLRDAVSLHGQRPGNRSHGNAACF